MTITHPQRRVTIRLTDEQYAVIVARSAAHGTNVADYVRSTATAGDPAHMDLWDAWWHQKSRDARAKLHGWLDRKKPQAPTGPTLF